MKNKINLQIVFTIFLILCGKAVFAQSTVFNAPSADVVGARSTYIEADFFAHPASYEKGGFQTYGLRGVYGVNNKTEVGLNAFWTKTSGAAQPVEIQPNFKYRFYENEKHGVKAAVGGVLYAPINHRRGTDAFGMVYATVSKKFNSNYGPKFTTGAYGLVARQKDTGNRKGFLVGYEQPLHRKVSFVADWFSGKNRFGYGGGGLAFTVSKKSLLYVGYNVGNAGHRNNYLSVFYGYTF